MVPPPRLRSFRAPIASRGTPADIVTAMAHATPEVLRLPEVAARLAVLGAVPVGSTPEEFAAVLRRYPTGKACLRIRPPRISLRSIRATDWSAHRRPTLRKIGKIARREQNLHVLHTFRSRGNLSSRSYFRGRARCCHATQSLVSRLTTGVQSKSGRLI